MKIKIKKGLLKTKDSKKIIEKAKSEGSISLGEVDKLIPDNATAEDIDKILDTLSNYGITIVQEGKEHVTRRRPKTTLRPEEPIRAYFKELAKYDLLQYVVPSLSELVLDTISVVFSGGENLLEIQLDQASLRTENCTVDSIQFKLVSHDQNNWLNTYVRKVSFDSLNIDDLYLNFKRLDNKWDIDFIKGDSVSPSYRLNGHICVNRENENIRLSIDPRQLIINGEEWTIDRIGQYNPDQGDSEEISLRNQEEMIKFKVDDDHTVIQLKKINLNNIFSLMTYADKSLPLQGALDTEINFYKRNKPEKLFMNIENLEWNDQLLGNLNVDIHKHSSGILMNGEFRQHENKILFGGKLDTENKKKWTGRMEINFPDISDFTIYTKNFISDLNGSLYGMFSFSENDDNFLIDGNIDLKEFNFLPTTSKSYFGIKDQVISVKENQIILNNMTIYDSGQNKLTLNGKIDLNEPINPFLNLDISGNGFHLMDTEINQNRTIFGKLIISTGTQIIGKQKSPKITSNIKILSPTDLTYVWSSSELDIISDKDIVVWGSYETDYDREKLYLADSVLDKLTGAEYEIKLVVDPGSKFRVDIDPGSGDYILVKGKGDLLINKKLGNPEPGMSGKFEITGGEYNVSFYGLVKQKFQIQERSYINWTGNSDQAEINISATNTITTSPLTLVYQSHNLVKNEKELYSKPLPFDINLHLKGELYSPVISFNIELPHEFRVNYPTVTASLNELNQPGNESELNRQVFGLLSIGSFIPANMGSIDYGATFVSTAASNSLNGILTSQLNKLSGKILPGFDVNVDMQSFNEFYGGSTAMRSTMDLNISRSLLNDRLNIEAGGNIDLDQDSEYSNFRGDIAIVYDLSEKNRYMLKLYNDASFDIIYKEIRSTGLSLIFIREFDSFQKRKDK